MCINRKILSVFLTTVMLLNAHLIPAVQPMKLQHETLVPGVSYACYQANKPPLYVHVVKVDLLQKGVKVGAVRAQGRESVTQLAQRYTTDKHKVIAVINGDYFDGDEKIKGPWGMHIQEGEVIFTPALKRSTFLVDLDGRPMIDIPRLQLTAQFSSSPISYDISNVNRYYNIGEQGLHLFSTFGDNDRVLVKNSTGMTLNGGTLEAGKTIKCKITGVAAQSGNIDIPSNGLVLCYNGTGSATVPKMTKDTEVRINAQIYPAATEAVGGGPRILRDGRVTAEFGKEGFSPAIEACLKWGKHPRSAVGYSSDRCLLFLVTVEGRIPRSEGMDIKELANFLLGLGASDAMTFDGGGSATLFTEKHKSKTYENDMRPVANGLAVFQSQDTTI